MLNFIVKKANVSYLNYVKFIKKINISLKKINLILKKLIKKNNFCKEIQGLRVLPLINSTVFTFICQHIKTL